MKATQWDRYILRPSRKTADGNEMRVPLPDAASHNWCVLPMGLRLRALAWNVL